MENAPKLELPLDTVPSNFHHVRFPNWRTDFYSNLVAGQLFIRFTNFGKATFYQVSILSAFQFFRVKLFLINAFSVSVEEKFEKTQIGW